MYSDANMPICQRIEGRRVTSPTLLKKRLFPFSIIAKKQPQISTQLHYGQFVLRETNSEFSTFLLMHEKLYFYMLKSIGPPKYAIIGEHPSH